MQQDMIVTSKGKGKRLIQPPRLNCRDRVFKVRAGGCPVSPN
jgi:hypothetical protein